MLLDQLKQGFDAVKASIKYEVAKLKLAKELKKIHNEFLSLFDVQRWLNFETYTVSSTGVIRSEKVKTIFITVTEKGIDINGETESGTYLVDCINGDIIEAQKVAYRIKEKYKHQLQETKKQYQKEIDLIDQTLALEEPEHGQDDEPEVKPEKKLNITKKPKTVTVKNKKSKD